MVADNTARHLASNFVVDVRGAGYLQMCWRILGSLEVSLDHVLSGIAVGILCLVLRTVNSRGRDDYGAVEKTLKGILKICAVLVFLVVVALSWTIYNGVKRFCYGESVVPAMPCELASNGSTWWYFHRGP